MYLFFFRATMMTLCMLVAMLVWPGCSYDYFLSLLAVAFLFGVTSSAVYYFSTTQNNRVFFQKIGLFHFLMNTFVILLLWKFIPGFHLASSSTALCLSGITALLAAMVQFFLMLRDLRAREKKVKMKSAKAKVISSKKNSLP